MTTWISKGAICVKMTVPDDLSFDAISMQLAHSATPRRRGPQLLVRAAAGGGAPPGGAAARPTAQVCQRVGRGIARPRVRLSLLVALSVPMPRISG